MFFRLFSVDGKKTGSTVRLPVKCGGTIADNHLFYVYSQQEHDDRINRANLAEYLEDQFYENEIPEKYDGSYEKWADSFSYDDMSEMLFDSSHCCEWPDICHLAGLDPNDDNNAFGEWTASMPVSHYKQAA